MTNTIPAVLAWPLLTFMAAVVILRYIFFNHSQWERYLNHTLAFMFAANLVRQRAVEDALSSTGMMTITTAQELSLALMIFTAAEFMGFITVWTRLSAQEARRRQRYHRLAAALLACAFFAAASPSRSADQTLEVHGGWSSVAAWSFYVLLLCVLATQLVWMCAKELRRPSAKRQERLVAASGLSIGLSIGITSLEAPALAALQELGWLDSLHYRTTLHGFIFFTESIGANALAAIPFVLVAFARAGYDDTSRHWRQLQPLRDAAITAVPEAAFELRSPNTSRRKTSLDLHQSTVQIRDAIMQLRPYFHCVPDAAVRRFASDHSVPDKQRQDAIDALQIAYAARAKNLGSPPTPVDSSVVLNTRSTNLDEETRELLRIARWWPQAAATAHHQPEMSTNP
ncbi:hypothetical protein DSM43518_02278 [Mycobacterium marinum]|uniref:MAB_1171c family putative transporter n=1 Tax=Mycobacterium marinum TaxID=1781 RepID=UPI000E3DC410|nr:MAB_1171c family putative transporter [Mycobacterium marinum]RFZ10364.1 hypothetical protein DSM43518_02278 [Mycobacterium marinum]